MQQINLPNLILTSVLNGTTLIFPLLLLIVYKINLFSINKETLIRAVNCTLLAGSVFYVITFVIQLFMGYYSQSEYEQYALTNRIFGPYWFVWLIMAFPSLILPQLLWIRKFQKKLIIAIIIISAYNLLLFFELWAAYPVTWIRVLDVYYSSLSNFLVKMNMYLSVLTIIYFIFYRSNFKQAESVIIGEEE